MLKQLREKRASIKSDMDAILASVGDENLTDEQQTQWNELEAQYKAVSANISNHEWSVSEQAKLDAVPEPKVISEVEDFRASITSTPRTVLRAFDSHEEAHAMGRWFLASVCNDRKSADWCRQNGIQATTMVGGTDELGGATVPDVMSATILKLVQEYGVFPRFARNITMTSDYQIVPQNQGGITVSTESEAASIDEANATWAKVALTATKKACLTRISSELNEDAIVNIIDDIVNDHARAHAAEIDTQGFSGTAGVATKINTSSGATYAGSIVTAAATHLKPEDFTINDFANLIGRLPNYVGAQNAFYMSKPVWASSIGRLAMSAGGNNVVNYGDGPSYTFFGYPVYFVNALNSTITNEASAIKVLFGDLSLAALFGTRRNLNVAMSTDRYFDTDELAVKTTTRWAVNVHSLGDTTNAGPMVALKTPSS